MHDSNSKFALLLRLSPTHWPIWEDTIRPGTYADVWFQTGRRRAEEIGPGIPVVILGTQGLGILGHGETNSCVECREDPDWREVPFELQAENRTPKNRVRVSVTQVRVPVEKVKNP